MSSSNWYMLDRNTNYPQTVPGSYNSSNKLPRGPNAYPHSDVLTSQYIHSGQPGGMYTTEELKANGTINVSIASRTMRENELNLNDYAFFDLRDNKNELVSLQQLNLHLARKQGMEFMASRKRESGVHEDLAEYYERKLRGLGGDNPENPAENEDGEPQDSRPQSEKYQTAREYHAARSAARVDGDRPALSKHEKTTAEYIIDYFRPYGAMRLSDYDAGHAYISKGVRQMTVAVMGKAELHDYWSHGDNIVQPYDTLYWLVKKVRIPDSTTPYAYQTNRNATSADAGVIVDGIAGRMIWQVVPYHNNKNTLDIENYSFVDEDGTEKLGSYWRLGRAEEYIDRSDAYGYGMRNNLSVSRDTAYLFTPFNLKPIFVYLDIQKMNKLI